MEISVVSVVTGEVKVSVVSDDSISGIQNQRSEGSQ